MCEVRVHPITRRLARGFEGLFPEHDLLQEPHQIVTMALQTQSRQTARSQEMMAEREECFRILVEHMTRFKEALDTTGHWCDFIDPSTGAPRYAHSSTTLRECDEQYERLGFKILELGCCRGICNDKFGQCLVITSAFVQAPEDVVAKNLPILEKALIVPTTSVLEHAPEPSIPASFPTFEDPDITKQFHA